MTRSRSGRMVARSVGKTTITRATVTGEIVVRLPDEKEQVAASAAEARLIYDRFMAGAEQNAAAGTRAVGVIEWYGFSISEVPKY